MFFVFSFKRIDMEVPTPMEIDKVSARHEQEKEVFVETDPFLTMSKLEVKANFPQPSFSDVASLDDKKGSVTLKSAQGVCYTIPYEAAILSGTIRPQVDSELPLWKFDSSSPTITFSTLSTDVLHCAVRWMHWKLLTNHRHASVMETTADLKNVDAEKNDAENVEVEKDVVENVTSEDPKTVALFEFGKNPFREKREWQYLNLLAAQFLDL